MAQTILSDEGGARLHRLAADVEAALRYRDEDHVEKEHVSRWNDELKAILAERVIHRHGGGRKKAVAAETAG